MTEVDGEALGEGTSTHKHTARDLAADAALDALLLEGTSTHKHISEDLAADAASDALMPEAT